MLNRLTVMVILISLAAAPAAGQTSSSPRRTFVDVTLAPDWDDYYSGSARIPGATWRAGIALGLDWGRSGVEIDVSVPEWHIQHQSFGWQQQGHSYEHSATVRHRSIDVTALYRGNLPLNRRVTFTWLAGGGYVHRPAQVTSVTNEVRPDGQLIEVNVNHDTSSRDYLAVIGRVDVEFRVAPRLSVLPRLRVTAFPAFVDDSSSAPRLLIARPEIAMRWQF